MVSMGLLKNACKQIAMQPGGVRDGVPHTFLNAAHHTLPPFVSASFMHRSPQTAGHMTLVNIVNLEVFVMAFLRFLALHSVILCNIPFMHCTLPCRPHDAV